MTVELSKTELLSRLRSGEDNFVERKTSGYGSKEFLKAIVAFANSAPIGAPCILYIGVTDNGQPEANQPNLDSLQKTLNREMADVFPPVPYFPRTLPVDSGRECLAVIVYGSELRPHFTGHAYARFGSETRRASEGEFEELIASRNSKTREILKWKNQPVTVELMNPPYVWYTHGRVAATREMFVERCNQFYVTLSASEKPDSFILERVAITFDHEKNRLKLEIHPGRVGE